ncbi:MAG: glycosyltransferase family 39 protein [Phycisphaerae bacterium]|nr:glycosyltransferase family 39 protein [Phycisphaerae bacterium]
MFAIFAVIYGISCAPGLLWQDSGLIQYRVLHHDLQGFFGLALAHPLYYWIAFLAKLIPFGEVLHRINLISALAGAVAVANVYLLVRLWLGKTGPAVLAAVSLGLSHTFWRHACIAETYTLWAMLFTFELIVLCLHVKTQKTSLLYVLAGINGLAISVHMLGCLSAVCYLGYGLSLLVKKRVKASEIALIMFIWVIGTLPYTSLIFLEMVRSHDVLGTLASAAFGDRWQEDVLNASVTWRIARENVLYIVLNCPSVNIGLFFLGLYGVFLKRTRQSMIVMFGALAAVFLLFAWRYTVADRYAFFIPFYCVMAVFMGKGLSDLMQKSNNRWLIRCTLALSLCPAIVYFVAPNVLKRQGITLGTRQNIPYRDDLTYFLQPWKTGYGGAGQFAGEVFEQLAQGAVLYADNTTVAPLVLYQAIHGSRPDVHVVSAVISTPGAPEFSEASFDRLIKTRPVYVVSDQHGYFPSFLIEYYEMHQRGHIFQVIKPK